MLEKLGRGWEIWCDAASCQERLEVDSEDFADVPKTLRRHNWLTRKDEDGDWMHFCPLCRDEEES